MKLLIAIPALNEEDGIQDIIQRSLAAREFIVQNSPVTSVEVTVVSDGSTDRTVERASNYRDQIRLIVFPENRGYGAAIKEAWRQSDAALLGFLDADGTCDPDFFADLCGALQREGADIALGCRLNPKSSMPVIRRIGNVLFAILLNLVSSRQVRDTASGMRVVRRATLEKILPLPNGLHFTPAMSARGMLSRSLKIVEIDMPYHERTGESKLHVLRDGLRFLKVIVETAFLYRPSRPLDLLAFLFFAGAAILMVQPSLHYLRTQTVSEWMIYRFVVSQLSATSGLLMLSISHLTSRMVRISLSDEAYERRETWRDRLFRGPIFWIAVTLMPLAGLLLVFRGFLELAATGHVYEHWSRFIVMSFFVSSATILAVTRAADYVLGLVASRVHYLKETLGETPEAADASPPIARRP